MLECLYLLTIIYIKTLNYKYDFKKNKK